MSMPMMLIWIHGFSVGLLVGALAVKLALKLKAGRFVKSDGHNIRSAEELAKPWSGK